MTTRNRFQEKLEDKFMIPCNLRIRNIYSVTKNNFSDRMGYLLTIDVYEIKHSPLKMVLWFMVQFG